MPQQSLSLPPITPSLKRINPGHLLAPFDWAVNAVVEMLQADASLYSERRINNPSVKRPDFPVARPE
jgi:hypothetical protein